MKIGNKETEIEKINVLKIGLNEGIIDYVETGTSSIAKSLLICFEAVFPEHDEVVSLDSKEFGTILSSLRVYLDNRIDEYSDKWAGFEELNPVYNLLKELDSIFNGFEGNVVYQFEFIGLK